MSVTFYGQHTSETHLVMRLTLNYEHPDHLNLNNGNAAALLGLLGLPCDNGYGQCSLPEARRAIMQARARFERKAKDFTRETVDERRGRRARFISGGIDEDGLMSRLDRFEAFVDTMARLGADTLYWA